VIPEVSNVRAGWLSSRGEGILTLMTINLPDIPKARQLSAADLRMELACALYARGRVGQISVTELAGVDLRTWAGRADFRHRTGGGGLLHLPARFGRTRHLALHRADAGRRSGQSKGRVSKVIVGISRSRPPAFGALSLRDRMVKHPFLVSSCYLPGLRATNVSLFAAHHCSHLAGSFCGMS
jgi:hypothetical protein